MLQGFDFEIPVWDVGGNSLKDCKMFVESFPINYSLSVLVMIYENKWDRFLSESHLFVLIVIWRLFSSCLVCWTISGTGGNQGSRRVLHVPSAESYFFKLSQG